MAAATAAVVPASAAPNTPESLSPSGGQAVAGAPVLQWDRVPGATSYLVKVADNPSFTKPLVSVTTTNRRYVPTIKLPTGALWWQVQAKDKTGSGQEAIDSFSVDPYGAPTPLAPESAATLVQPAQPLVLSWQPVAGATSYSVEIDTSAGFPAPVAYSKIKTPSYLVQNPKVATDYYWRVKADFGGGIASDWSADQTFTIAGLAKPQLVRPADLTGDLGNPAGWVDGVVLEWTPVAGAVRYELEVSTDDAFSHTRESRSDILGTTFSPNADYWNDQYFWRVRGIDAFGNKSDWGGPWLFGRRWTDKPVRVWPADGATVGAPLFFQWEATRRSTNYRVQWRAQGTSVWKACQDTVHTTQATDCGPASAGDYEWRLDFWDAPGPKAKNPGGYNGGPIQGEQLDPAISTFTYDPTITDTPTTGPDVTGMRVAASGTASQTPAEYCGLAPADGTCEEIRLTPVFRWDPVAGAGKYQITIANDAAFTNLVQPSVFVTEPMYTYDPTETLPDNQAGDGYYWQVQACMPACPPLDNSGRRVFNKRSNYAEVTAPADGATLTTDVVHLQWTDWLASNQANPQDSGVIPQLEARQYLVEVSSVPNFQALEYSAAVDQTEHSLPLTLLPDGVHYWRVTPIDGGRNTLSNSGTYVPGVGAPDTRMFTKTTPAPTLARLNSGAPLSRALPLTWGAVDFAAQYDVEVYKDTPIPELGEPVVQLANRVVNTTSKQAAVVLDKPLAATLNPYVWRVRKKDARGNYGPWSKLDQNATFTMAAEAPAPTAPSTGARVGSLDSLFTWIPVEAAANYRFEMRKVGTTSLVSTATTVSPAWAPVKALANGTYEWRVIALDLAKNQTGASAWRSASVTDASATAGTGTTPPKPAAPTVRSITPRSGTTVKKKQNFVIVFSTAVSNVTAATVYVRNPKGKKVKGRTTTEAGGIRVVFKPAKPLKTKGTYTLTVTNKVTDRHGQALKKSVIAKYSRR